MSRAKQRRTRRHRRLNKMRCRTGKKIVTHKLRSGRTGKAHYVKRKAQKNGERRRELNLPTHQNPAIMD